MAESPRRFPPPWRADKVPGGYVVRDANGQALASVEADAAISRSAACIPFFKSFQPCRTALCKMST
jgi:hypothetical protein